MKYACIALIFLTLFVLTSAQDSSKNIKFIEINKNVNEYPDQFDLSSPIKAFVTFKYLQSKGKEGLYRKVNSYRLRGYFPQLNSPDIIVEKEKVDKLLNTKLKEVIVYKDSVAGMITEYVDPMCIITYLSYEDGKWLNAGEDLGKDLDNAREVFKSKCDNFLNYIHRISELQSVPADTSSFVDYVKNNGEEPREFIINALASHKIVIYGEIHRRKVSWDLMKSVVTSPSFVEKVGTVFMELSSDKQSEIDQFYLSKKLEPEKILDVFRSVQINGWYDKGMYEFLIDIWKLNQTLPAETRIKVICTDEPRPFDSFKTREEMEAHFNSILDRNTQMAKIISENIKANNDKRNNLFIVGCAHAYKSGVGGVGVGKPIREAEPTAAYQLAKIFSPEEVFSIFTHCQCIDNNGNIWGGIRNGLFDSVFTKCGNKPVAFGLEESPFGKEPFDGIYEITYAKGTGAFVNNYDAYIYLGQLDSEQGEYLLYDILTDDYVRILKKRAAIVNTTIKKWFGISEPTKEAIIKKLKSSADEKRWSQR